MYLYDKTFFPTCSDITYTILRLKKIRIKVYFKKKIQHSKQPTEPYLYHLVILLDLIVLLLF